MPILVGITAQCRSCRLRYEFEAQLVVDPSRQLLAVHRDAAVAHLYEHGWAFIEMAPPGKTKWPSGTGVWDWLCEDCRNKAPLP